PRRCHAWNPAWLFYCVTGRSTARSRERCAAIISGSRCREPSGTYPADDQISPARLAGPTNCWLLETIAAHAGTAERPASGPDILNQCDREVGQGHVAAGEAVLQPSLTAKHSRPLFTSFPKDAVLWTEAFRHELLRIAQ